MESEDTTAQERSISNNAQTTLTEPTATEAEEGVHGRIQMEMMPLYECLEDLSEEGWNSFTEALSNHVTKTQFLMMCLDIANQVTLSTLKIIIPSLVRRMTEDPKLLIQQEESHGQGITEFTNGVLTKLLPKTGSRLSPFSSHRASGKRTDELGELEGCEYTQGSAISQGTKKTMGALFSGQYMKANKADSDVLTDKVKAVQSTSSMGPASPQPLEFVGSLIVNTFVEEIKTICDCAPQLILNMENLPENQSAESSVVLNASKYLEVTKGLYNKVHQKVKGFFKNLVILWGKGLSTTESEAIHEDTLLVSDSFSDLPFPHSAVQPTRTMSKRLQPHARPLLRKEHSDGTHSVPFGECHLSEKQVDACTKDALKGVLTTLCGDFAEPYLYSDGDSLVEKVIVQLDDLISSSSSVTSESNSNGTNKSSIEIVMLYDSASKKFSSSECLQKLSSESFQARALRAVSEAVLKTVRSHNSSGAVDPHYLPERVQMSSFFFLPVETEPSDTSVTVEHSTSPTQDLTSVSERLERMLPNDAHLDTHAQHLIKMMRHLLKEQEGVTARETASNSFFFNMGQNDNSSEEDIRQIIQTYAEETLKHFLLPCFSITYPAPSRNMNVGKILPQALSSCPSFLHSMSEIETGGASRSPPSILRTAQRTIHSLTSVMVKDLVSMLPLTTDQQPVPDSQRLFSRPSSGDPSLYARSQDTAIDAPPPVQRPVGSISDYNGLVTVLTLRLLLELNNQQSLSDEMLDVSRVLINRVISETDIASIGMSDSKACPEGVKIRKVYRAIYKDLVHEFGSEDFLLKTMLSEDSSFEKTLVRSLTHELLSTSNKPNSKEGKTKKQALRFLKSPKMSKLKAFLHISLKSSKTGCNNGEQSTNLDRNLDTDKTGLCGGCFSCGAPVASSCDKTTTSAFSVQKPWKGFFTRIIYFLSKKSTKIHPQTLD